MGSTGYKLYVQHNFRYLVVKERGLFQRNRWMTETSRYYYAVFDRNHRQVFSYRWVPDLWPGPTPLSATSTAHVSFGEGMVTPQTLGTAWYPTRRVPLEDLVFLLITHFGVTPLLPDWQERLQGTLAEYENRVFEILGKRFEGRVSPAPTLPLTG